MKKVFAILAVASMVSFTACNNAAKEAEVEEPAVVEEVVAVEEEAPVAEEEAPATETPAETPAK